MKFNMGLQQVHWEKQKKLVEVWFYYHLCWPLTSDQCPAKALIRLKAAFQFISLNILREIDTNAGLQKDRPDRREESGKQKTKRNERYLGSNKGWRRPIASKMVDELMTWDFVLKWFPGTTLWDRGSPDAWYQNSENLPQNMWSAFWVSKSPCLDLSLRRRGNISCNGGVGHSRRIFGRMSLSTLLPTTSSSSVSSEFQYFHIIYTFVRYGFGDENDGVWSFNREEFESVVNYFNDNISLLSRVKSVSSYRSSLHQYGLQCHRVYYEYSIYYAAY